MEKFISAGLIAVYFFLPFDLIPDFLTVFGIVDDLTLFFAVLQLIVKMAPESLAEKYDLSGMI